MLMQGRPAGRPCISIYGVQAVGRQLRMRKEIPEQGLRARSLRRRYKVRVFGHRRGLGVGGGSELADEVDLGL